MLMVNWSYQTHNSLPLLMILLLTIFIFTNSHLKATVPDWSTKITCSSSLWASYNGESYLNSDNSTIYSAFLNGSMTGSAYYFYYTTFSASTGGVLSIRYKSNVTCVSFYGSAMSVDYILYNLDCTSIYLLILNTASTSFTLKKFSGTYLVGGIDSSGR